MEILIEGAKRKKDGWLATLEASAAEFDALVERQILRAFQDEDLGRCFRLDLVGLIFTDRNAFVSLPKIFGKCRGPRALAVTRDVMACLSKYFKRGPSRAARMSASEVLSIHDDQRQVINTFQAILNWSVDHGFQKEATERPEDDFGDVDWRATIDDGLPLHIGNSVIFSEIVGREKFERIGALARAQALCLSQLHAHLSPVSELWLGSNSDLVAECNEVLRETQDQTSPVDAESIRHFLTECNLDADRELATILLEWLEKRHRASSAPAVYGSTDFHFVWEDMCRFVMVEGNANVAHASIASQPIYHFQSAYRSGGEQRPDVLLLLNECCYIYDAKWYCADDSSLPGVGDIIKQFMYERSLKPSIGLRANGFLLPTAKASVEIVGSATMHLPDAKSDSRFPEVSLLAIPWSRAADAYCGLSSAKELREKITAVTPCQ